LKEKLFKKTDIDFGTQNKRFNGNSFIIIMNCFKKLFLQENRS
jgi:hypothetical protein